MQYFAILVSEVTWNVYFSLDEIGSSSLFYSYCLKGLDHGEVVTQGDNVCF